MLHAVQMPPPPLCLATALRKNRPLVPRSNSGTTFFYHGIGFFMILVDAGRVTIHSPDRFNSNHPEPTRNPP